MGKKVFLGGTCNGSTWREQLIPLLGIGYFNPVVDDWDEAAFEREQDEKAHDDFCLYCITPKLTGVYAIAEVVDDSNKRPEKTLLCVLLEDAGERFSDHQAKALAKVGDMVAANGAQVFTSLADVADFLNE